MGAFFVNHQVRSDDTDAVAAAVTSLAKGRAYVSPPHNGWITVYDEKSDEQDDAVIKQLAQGLSAGLHTAVMAFLVHDSGVFCYWLFDDGASLDEYNSAPDYFEEVATSERQRLRGKPEKVQPYCLAGTTIESIASVLDPEEQTVMAEDTTDRLAALLGVDQARAMVGFRYLEEESDVLADAEAFRLVGRGAKRRKPRRAAPTALAPAASQAQMAAAAAPDTFGLAVTMLFQGMDFPAKMREMLAKLPGGGLFPGLNKIGAPDKAIDEAQRKFRNQVKQLLKTSSLAHRFSDAELLAAADRGPEELAAFLATHAPTSLDAIVWGLAASDMTESSYSFAGLRVLLARGASANADNRGITALMHAAARGSVAMVQLLLQHGADVNRLAPDGRTALSWAKAMTQHHEEDRQRVIELLVQAGAV